MKRNSQKKQMAKQAVNQAIALANANSGKLKSVKIKIKFNGNKSQKKTRHSINKARGGY